jgi:hypothetical protein
MRGTLLLSIGVCCTAFILPANAVVTAPDRGVGAGHAIIGVAQRGPPGSWWIPEGYQRKGKWKPAHCSKVTRSN